MFFRGQDFSYLPFNAGSSSLHNPPPDRPEIIIDGSIAIVENDDKVYLQ